jgi:serine acetyltransferase
VSVLSDLRADLRRDGCTRITVVPRILLAPRCQALVLMRLSQLWPGTLGIVFRRINYTRNGCDIAAQARIGASFAIPHPVGVVIGPDVVIGERCEIRQLATLGLGASGSPKVHDDVTIGIGAIIFGGITIGDGAQVAAHSIVRDDVPAGVLVAGIPAVVKGTNRRITERGPGGA